MSQDKILIIEDDRDIVGMLRYNLQKEGYEILVALDGEDGIDLAKKQKPNLIILDIMLPVVDGFEVCRVLKKDNAAAHIPIVILSAKSQETDKVVGLELGADDYITKPFSPRELIARIRAVLRRRQQQQSGGRIERGDIVIDGARHKVAVKGKEISLTLTELKLLEFMARRIGFVFAKCPIDFLFIIH
jgi:two-component system alkaline phosphatase synthesis response regulator PhoP